MFVKMCMLCAFSSLICSPACSPMSPALPGGLGRSLTLFIQTEQLGPSQPKQRGMGREGGCVEKLSWKLQVKPSVGNVSLFPFFFSSLVFLAVLSLSRLCNPSGRVRSYSAQVSRIDGSPSHVPSISLFASSPLFIGHATCFLKHSRCLYF